MIKYKKFDLPAVALRARNYLTSMVDESFDFLPYWLIQIDASPAFARHVRVDDAELVASWYEAIICIQKIVGQDHDSEKVEQAFKRHLMKSWGPKGLRYHEDYPWSETNHASFHEMGYVLSALNRLLHMEPDNEEAEKRAADLIRGMRELVVERKIKTFWSGDFPMEKKIYEFPEDIYLRDGGWTPERVTGRGEKAIRNGVVLHPLVVRAELHGDKAALDLAEGLANHLLTLSRYFNWKGEFMGHVHSTAWVASGLARLGRITQNDRYIEKADIIFNYIKAISSEFGWVPEYAQWHPPGEEHCETCCIKSMIQCALELIDCGYDYWELIDKYTRNQLEEQQIKDGSFVKVDNTKEDTEDCTWHDLDKRIVGGWSGGSNPNSISLSRFRSVAGCCVGTAPQALLMIWERIITEEKRGIYINLPIEKENQIACVEIGYPNKGCIKVDAKKRGDYYIRAFDWMDRRIEMTHNGQSIPLRYADSCLFIPNVKEKDKIIVSHPLKDSVKKEIVKGCKYTVTWRGPDAVEIDPPGPPLQLYQRELEISDNSDKKDIGNPKPTD